MNRFNTGWYLIYTKPQHEKKVHRHLIEKEINSFLPLVQKIRTLPHRKKCIEAPLFPSYVFVYLEDFHNYYDGMDSDGALYYVKTGNKMALVSEAVIMNLRLVSDHARDLEISHDRFQPGQRLMISQGALTGLTCEVVEFNNSKRLLVRVDLLQRNLLLTLPPEYLISPE